MGVAGGALQVRVPQQLADHGEALACRERPAGEAVAQVVDAHVVEPGPRPHPVPRAGDGGEVRARRLADDDPGVVRHPRDLRQHRVGRGRQRHHARAGLAVAQAKLARGAVHVVPAQRQDLIEPAPGQQQQAQRGDGVGRCRARRLRLRQRGAEAAVLVAAEEALALALPVAADRAARVAPLLDQAPGGGEGEHLGQHHERPVGRARGGAQPVVERRHVGALDRAERQRAQRRQDVVVERAAIDAGRVRVAVDRHVGAQVARGELGDGGLGAAAQGVCVLAPLDAVDDPGGPLARLLGAERAVGAEGDAARRTVGPALHHIDLAARGIDAHAEAGEVAVPVDRVRAAGRQALHRAPGNGEAAPPGHRPPLPSLLNIWFVTKPQTNRLVYGERSGRRQRGLARTDFR